jgi:hypothetical protein
MFLRGVRQHLTRDGRLVFDVHLSTPDELSRIGDYDVMAQVSRRPLEGSRRIQISQRHYHPEEVLVLLRHNGFEHVRLTADYTGRALDERAKRMVVSARPS